MKNYMDGYHLKIITKQKKKHYLQLWESIPIFPICPELVVTDGVLANSVLMNFSVPAELVEAGMMKAIWK